MENIRSKPKLWERNITRTVINWSDLSHKLCTLYIFLLGSVWFKWFIFILSIILLYLCIRFKTLVCCCWTKSFVEWLSTAISTTTFALLHLNKPPTCWLLCSPCVRHVISKDRGGKFQGQAKVGQLLAVVVLISNWRLLFLPLRLLAVSLVSSLSLSTCVGGYIEITIIKLQHNISMTVLCCGEWNTI